MVVIAGGGLVVVMAVMEVLAVVAMPAAHSGGRSFGLCVFLPVFLPMAITQGVWGGGDEREEWGRPREACDGVSRVR